LYTSVVKGAWVNNATSKFWNILTNLYITTRHRTTNKFKFRYTPVKEMTQNETLHECTSTLIQACTVKDTTV